MTDTQKIGRIVARILHSYENKGAINRTGGENLPSQEHIINIMKIIRKIIYPGYYDRMAVEDTALPYTTGERVVWLYKHLSEEINKCICFEHNKHHERLQQDECRSLSENIVLGFLNEIPVIRELLQLDVQAALDGDPAANSRDEIIMAYPSIAAMTVHRVVHYLHCKEVPLLPRIMSEYIHHQTGIDIHPGATIGKSFFIDHGTGVVIGETTIIGDRVKLYQGVTIGALSVERTMKGHKRHPTLEDDVTIYSGATVLGGETVIGRGAVVGGNMWVVKSVPPNTRLYNNK
ncbi:MAG: serine acetyltransferase [FCB group bacterium]|nr:serine acetyltransferase [FCB group bacterium]